MNKVRRWFFMSLLFLSGCWHVRIYDQASQANAMIDEVEQHYLEQRWKAKELDEPERTKRLEAIDKCFNIVFEVHNRYVRAWHRVMENNTYTSRRQADRFFNLFMLLARQPCIREGPHV